MKKISLLSLIVASSILFAGCTSSTPSSDLKMSDIKTSSPEKLSNPTEKGGMKTLADFEKIDAKTVRLSTSKGDVELELYPDMAPVTVASFLSLIKAKFYDGIVIHRVEPGFVIQAGDPQTKEKGTEALWGTGGPGYTIPDEFSSTFKYDQEGLLAMAKTQAPNSGGSQFFITLGPAEFLNGSYTPFGKVTKGMDVVKSFAVGDVIITATYK